jgi:hypothetical protein
MLLIVVVSSSFLLTQGNKPSDSVWREYTYPADGFAISAPSQPNIHPDPQAADVAVYSWRFGTDAAGSVHAGVRPNCLEMIGAFKETLRTGTNKYGMRAVGKEISLEGHPGIESREEKNGRQLREHIYCVGQKAYDITGIWIAGQPEPTVITRWLNSFRLVSGGSR